MWPSFPQITHVARPIFWDSAKSAVTFSNSRCITIHNVSTNIQIFCIEHLHQKTILGRNTQVVVFMEEKPRIVHDVHGWQMRLAEVVSG